MDINSLIGIPFAEHGRNDEGLDCWGLVLKYHHTRDLPDFTGYRNTRPNEAEKQVQASRYRFTETESPIDGDIVLMRSCGHESHVGIYIEGKVLHAKRRVGVVLERMANLNVSRFYRV